jgi:hypothetical protein
MDIGGRSGGGRPINANFGFEIVVVSVASGPEFLVHRVAIAADPTRENAPAVTQPWPPVRRSARPDQPPVTVAKPARTARVSPNKNGAEISHNHT